MGQLLLGHVEFFGRTLAEIGRVLANPRLLRVHELFAQLGQVGVNAIPVVVLVTFLIGVVMAYMLGLQAERFGANIFVVDGVALGMTREFSPLIVATIMAGRSGAAFTAQLGTMKLTEEIDAIRTLGLEPAQVLVVPRVLALVLTLPLLVFVGNVAGLAGAAMMANATLDITPQVFINRLHLALAPRHYVIGLSKAPVFALFIAVIGCRMGMSVSRDTRSIGINTTSTVVQGIVAVILLDAMFAVFFQELEL
jgi:phospholipid/cholesterol/gamma-HCH transport system permease protein